MKTLTVHQKINFRSNFKPESNSWFMRVKRHLVSSNMLTMDDRNTYSTEIPFWSELGGYFTKKTRFINKY
jgi:hypothetical protein